MSRHNLTKTTERTHFGQKKKKKKKKTQKKQSTFVPWCFDIVGALGYQSWRPKDTTKTLLSETKTYYGISHTYIILGQAVRVH